MAVRRQVAKCPHGIDELAHAIVVAIARVYGDELTSAESLRACRRAEAAIEHSLDGLVRTLGSETARGQDRHASRCVPSHPPADATRQSSFDSVETLHRLGKLL